MPTRKIDTGYETGTYPDKAAGFFGYPSGAATREAPYAHGTYPAPDSKVPCSNATGYPAPPPPTTVVDNQFDGTAGTLLTTLGYGQLTIGILQASLELDGTGKIKGPGPIASAYGGNVNLTPAGSADMWAEIGVLCPASQGIYRWDLGVRRPGNGSADDVGDYYFQLQGDAVGTDTWYIRDESATVVASAVVPGSLMTKDVEHVVRLEARGPVLTGFVDGAQVITWTDPTPSLTGQYAAFYTLYCYVTYHKFGAL